MVCEWNSLENFNKTDLEATVAGEKKDIKKPYIIGASVAGAAALAAAAGTVVYKIIKKKKHGKD